MTGGGRLAPVLMKGLRDATGADVRTSDCMGWDSDALETQTFAYLAVRSVRWLPITFPLTTGVSEPMTGRHSIIRRERQVTCLVPLVKIYQATHSVPVKPIAVKMAGLGSLRLLIDPAYAAMAA